MTRFVFSIACSVILARWMYAEIAMTVPGMIPVIDYSVERLSIPTHDKWSKEPFVDALSAVEEIVQKYQAEDWAPGATVAKQQKKYDFSEHPDYSPINYSPSEAPYFLRAGTEYVRF